MSATALARLERVLLMVPWILERDGATYAELAARFGSTPDEIAADLDILGYCGLPGYGGGDLVEVATFGDEVTIRMADFFRRPLRLSLREAVTLLLAARSLAQLDGLAESAALDRAVARLEEVVAVAAPAEATRVRMAVDVEVAGSEHLALLREAVRRRRVVHLTYRSPARGGVTERDVEPWSVVGESGAWYLRGWCRSAAGHRDFRLDRIAAVATTDETAPPREPPPTPSPATYVPSPGDAEVDVDLAPGARWLAERLGATPGAERTGPDGEGGWRTYRFRVRSLTWLARRLLPLGSGQVGVRDAALAAVLRQLAAEVERVHGGAAP